MGAYTEESHTNKKPMTNTTIELLGIYVMPHSSGLAMYIKIVESPLE